MGRLFYFIIFFATLLVPCLSPGAGARALELPSGVSILEHWTSGQHVYTAGELGVGVEKLNDFENWIRENSPNWTVLLMETSEGEVYTDVFGREHLGIDAVEHAMGLGLPASTGFGDLKDPESGLANGAIFILFLKDRKFSYYGGEAYRRYGLGKDQWNGDLDRPAIAAMKEGGRIIDCAGDSIRSIDDRYRKAVIGEKDRAQKNLEDAEMEMERVEALMARAGRQYEEFWKKFDKPGKGEFGRSPVDEWQVDFERVRGYRRDGKTMLQQGGISQLEKKVEAWRRNFQKFSNDRAQLRNLREDIGRLVADDEGQVDLLLEIQGVLGQAEAAYAAGEGDYVARIDELAVMMGRFVRRSEQLRSRQRMFGVAGAGGAGVLGLMGFIGNRRRRRIKLEAETLLERRKVEMKEMVDRLFMMMDRAAIVVGPVHELDSRGYTGETLRLSREALQKIDEAFVTSSNVKQIVGAAESKILPGELLGRSRNLVSGGRFEEAVGLLDAEVRAEAHEVPDLEERVRPGVESGEVFAMPLDEWKERTMEALNQAAQSLNEVDEAWTTIVSRREKLEAAIKGVLGEWRDPADEWLRCEATFQAWVPAIKEAFLEGSEMGRTDPVGALAGPLKEGERMISEVGLLLNLVSRFRQDDWPLLEEGEKSLDSQGRATLWMDRKLADLSALCNEIAGEGCLSAVAGRIGELEIEMAGFVEGVTAAVQVSGRAEVECGPAIKSAVMTVERGRRELAAALKLEPVQVLAEESHNPSTYLAEANLQFQGALAALDLGEAATAAGFLDEVGGLIAHVLELVEDSRRFHKNFPEASEELWRRRELLEDLVKKAKKTVDGMRSRYAPAALHVEPGSDSGASYVGAATRLDGFLVGIVHCLGRGKTAMTEGRLLECRDLIEEGRNLASAGEELSRDVKRRATDLAASEVASRSVLEVRMREMDGLGQLILDRRVMKGTVIEFGNLEVRLREASEMVDAPEGRIDPYLSNRLLDEIHLRLPVLQEAIADDIEEYGNACRLLETLRVALDGADRLCDTARTDRIPDSRPTSDAQHQIQSRRNEWEEIGVALEGDHGDWRLLQQQLRAIHLGLSESILSLRKELELARQAVRFLQTGAEDVNRAAAWSGHFGARINGRPGGDALDRGNRLMLEGSYQQAMEWAGRARSEARSAVAAAEAAESARALAEERRRARRAEEARRSRLRSEGFGQVNLSAGRSSSSGIGSGRKHMGTSSPARGGGSSVGRSSFSSGSGVGRSGW